MAARRILVLGAGVVGVTTAYKLAAAGHEVAVIESDLGGAHVVAAADVEVAEESKVCFACSVSRFLELLPKNQQCAHTPRTLSTQLHSPESTPALTPPWPSC